MAKATTKLNAQDRVILFCAATGIDHAAVGILARAMQSMAIRGFIVHDRESGAYALTDSERATLAVILKNAGLRRDQHVSMDELQSHVMPYARPRAAVAIQFNVVEMPGKRECGPPASWTIESQKPCASMVLEDLSSRIARQGAN